jgi:hypothetical protein
VGWGGRRGPGKEGIGDDRYSRSKFSQFAERSPLTRVALMLVRNSKFFLLGFSFFFFLSFHRNLCSLISVVAWKIRERGEEAGRRKKQKAEHSASVTYARR